MSQNVKIIYKNENVIIINKPCGIPSQSDTSGDKDAMTLTSELLATQGEHSRLWLVHRLDRTVGGLIAFARSKESAAKLSALIANEELKKQYFAVARGTVESGTYRDILYKDARQGKAFVISTKRQGAKEAILECEQMAISENSQNPLTLCKITLKTGRFHQIRAQLSSRGTPLVGDKKYGGTDKFVKFPALISARLSFRLFGEDIDVSILPDISEYPWSQFEETDYIKE